MVSEQPTITGYHAHIYYDAGTKPAARTLRRQIAARFDTALGRWHDRPVGPHPVNMYQVAFAARDFAEIVPWLALHRGGLQILVHPETGNDVADHSDFAMWLGDSMALHLDKLGP